MGGRNLNSRVLNNLSDTRNNLLKEIKNLGNEQFNRKLGEDIWSIAQVCQHIELVEKKSIQAVGWALKSASSSNQERKDIHLALDRTRKIRAPKMVEPGEEPIEVQKMVETFDQTRGKLLSLLAAIEDPAVLATKAVEHPAFGNLPLDQWIELIYLHEQRHIEQIKEIKSSLASATK